MQSQTLDAASPHASSAAAPSEAAAAAHRVLLLQRVTPAGQLLGGDGSFVIAGVIATNTGGALHGASRAPVAAVDDGAAALAGVPLLGEAASWLKMFLVLLCAAAAVDGGVVGGVVVINVVGVRRLLGVVLRETGV